MGPRKRTGPHVIAAQRRVGWHSSALQWRLWCRKDRQWYGLDWPAEPYASWAEAREESRRQLEALGIPGEWRIKLVPVEDWDRIRIQAAVTRG